MSTPTPTLTGAYTCTHHNDQQRTECPVCLVPALTAERDQLRHENSNLRAERDIFLAQLHTLQLVCGTTDADKISTWVDRANARAERAEADLKLLREWQRDVIQNASAHHAERKDAIARAESAEREAFDWKKIARYEAARAERAEADLAFQVARNSDLFTQRDEAFESQEKAETELTTEREKVRLLKARAAIDAAMKEDRA